jgi:23S rRNA (guanosine2251-2'-O)-methyltransferase
LKDQYLYGINAIQETLKSGKSIEKVFFLKENFNERLRSLRNELKEQGIPFSIVPKAKFKGIFNKNHQGVLALSSPIQFVSLDNLVYKIFTDGEDPFLLATDSITDVRNIGAISRSAQAFGCHGLITPLKGGAMLNADAIKASSGALLEIPVCRSGNLVKSLMFLKDSGLKVVAITERAKESIWDFDFEGPMVLVLGAEGGGIRNEILSICHQQLSIPMSSGVGSLNVSVAAGIACSALHKSKAN